MIYLTCQTTTEQLKANYENNKQHRDHTIGKINGIQLENPAIIIGSGPSLLRTANHSKRHKRGDKIALKTADVLIEQGIIPRFAIHYDPKPTEANYVYVDDRITYIVCNQCDPSVFQKLKGQTVYAVDGRINNEWYPSENFWLAGSNVGFASVYFADRAGYTDIHLYGFDYCFEGSENENTHTNRDSQWMRDNDTFIEVDGFKTTTAMAAMASELAKEIRFLSKTHKITVHGDGLLAYLLKTKKNIFFSK